MFIGAHDFQVLRSIKASSHPPNLTQAKDPESTGFSRDCQESRQKPQKPACDFGVSEHVLIWNTSMKLLGFDVSVFFYSTLFWGWVRESTQCYCLSLAVPVWIQIRITIKNASLLILIRANHIVKIQQPGPVSWPVLFISKENSSAQDIQLLLTQQKPLVYRYSRFYSQSKNREKNPKNNQH